ncbi:hypothetical protein ACFY1P_10515 [Streptomyces sp. NPDC001407]|uniref:hypothetical protein n=1 Tax=Streptomyces sp. NPDC001407 TaxID=3364573 RepID=UPI0036987C61
MAIPHARKALVTTAVATIALLAGFTTSSAAQPTPPQSTSTKAGVTSGDDEMPFAVEKFEYPEAAKILNERGIKLFKGDGRITFTDCAAVHDLEVRSRTSQKAFCFTVKGKQGYLSLELADAFGIWTQDHPVDAKITLDGKEKIVSAPKNDYTPFGEAGDTRKQAVLLELRVTG